MTTDLNVSDVVRAVKSSTKISDWHTGHLPRSVFPLSRVKPKAFKFGPDYKWRIVSFEACSGKYKILIILNETKAIFRATLAAESPGGELIVLCQHEYHQSEPGWHCHVSFANIASMPHGIFRSHLTRWPKYKPPVSEKQFPVQENSALSIAASRFRFQAQGDLI